MNDLRFALRQLLKNPGFTVVAVFTLALGIGANTASFSVLNAVLLKPLPYPDPQQLVTLWESSPERGIDQERVSGPNYLDWRAQNTVFAEMAASPGWDGVENFNLVLGDTTAKVRATYTSSSLFTALGTRPALGRTLSAEEDKKQGNRAVVLSHGLWLQYFNADPNILGQTLTLDTYGRRQYEIVGVMPPGFGEPSHSQLWLPMGWMGVDLTNRRSAHWHNVIARLKSGVTLAQAQAEMNSIQARLKQTYPTETIGSRVAVVPMLHQAIGRNLRTALLVLWGVVVGVLLIACANVANLLLARAASRQKEIAVRIALGAGRWRIARQLLTESIVLAIVGGALGVLLGFWLLRLFIAAAPKSIPRIDQVTLDGSALAFTLLISIITGLLFGLAPAFQFSRPFLGTALKEGTREASTGKAAGRTRNALVVAEVALSVVLLVGAALMLQSLARILAAERGFQPEHLVTAELDFSVSGYTTWVRPTATRPQVPLQQLLERLASMPGVQSVSAGSRLLRRENQPPHEPFTAFGWPTVKPEEQPKAHFMAVTPNWFRTIGAQFRQGRDFTSADILEAPGVVLINEALARRFFPNQDPIGQRIKMGANQPALNATNVYGLGEWSTIVGIVSNVKTLHPHPTTVPEIYVSHWQWPMLSPTIFLRTTIDPGQMADSIRRETKVIIPNLPPPIIRTMDDLLSETVAQPRLQTELLSLFACLALLLAAVGLYGVLAYLVTQRTREIGVRIALGAQRSNVLSLVIAHGMKLALAGVIIGVLAALALTRVLRNLLYDVQPTDPFAFAAVALVLLGIALIACCIPAWRAARVHPMQALRYE